MSIVKYISAIALAVTAVACAKFEVKKNKAEAVVTPTPPGTLTAGLTVSDSTNSFLGSASDDSYLIKYTVKDPANTITVEANIGGLGNERVTKTGVEGSTYLIETKCVTGACDTYAVLVTRTNASGKQQVAYYFNSGNRSGYSTILHSTANSNYTDVLAYASLFTSVANW